MQVSGQKQPLSGAIMPERRLIGRIPELAARALVRTYRYILSPLVGFRCRHLPTCSEYADEAFGRHGFWAGGWMTAGRLCRCQPWGTSGLDFVCEALPPESRWYMPWRYGRWRSTNPSVPFRDADSDATSPDR